MGQISPRLQKLYDATRDYQRWAAKLRAPRRRESNAVMQATAGAILRRLHDAIHTYEDIVEREMEAWR